MGLEEIDEDALKDITNLSYFNTSRWTLNRLKSQASDNNDLLYDNFAEYLNGYSENVRDVLKNFDYYNKARKLADNDRLLSIIERVTDPRINLTDKDQKDPDGLMLPALTNHGMGTVFEELPSDCWPVSSSNPSRTICPRLSHCMILLRVLAVC